MKNFTGNSFIAAAAISLAVGFSGHAAADIQDYATADDSYAAKLQLETTRSLDAALADRVFDTSFSDAIEEQDVNVTHRSQDRVEALYRLHNYARINDHGMPSDTI
jgi:hypothetical protein